MNIDQINVDSINDLEGAKRVISQLVDCIFVMNKDIHRMLNHLTSQNVKSIDFNITKVKNIDKVLGNYATKTYVANNYQPLDT